MKDTVNQPEAECLVEREPQPGTGGNTHMTILTRVVNRVLGYHSSRDFARHRGSEVLLLHDSGFFSNCSVLLMSLARAQQHPARIDVSRSFTHFTDEGKAFRWDDFFFPPNPLTDGQQSVWQKKSCSKTIAPSFDIQVVGLSNNESNLADLFSTERRCARESPRNQRDIPSCSFR